MTLDFERARFNMIEQQIRTWEVLDARVLEALKTVRREDFVDAKHRRLAFADVELPIEGSAQSMMKPVVEGRVLQALAVEPQESVLLVGVGSGFLAACLGRLGREVLCVERDPKLAARARERLADAGVGNVSVVEGDVLRDFAPGRDFDAIAIAAAVHALPTRLLEWLRPGGRLFVVRGVAPAMEAVRVTRDADGATREESLFETELPYLPGAEPPKRFVL